LQNSKKVLKGIYPVFEDLIEEVAKTFENTVERLKRYHQRGPRRFLGFLENG